MYSKFYLQHIAELAPKKVTFASQTALSSSRLYGREGGKSGHQREA